jgi:zinc protease
MKTSLLITLALLLAPGAASAAFELQAGPKSKNYLFEKDPKALASEIQFVLRSGSVHDPKGKEGLADLAFNCLLRGTKTKSRQDFNAALERLGASIGVDVGTDRTIISLNAVSDNLQPAIQLLAETLLQPGLKDSEIMAVKDESLAGLHQELANNRRILKRVFRQAIFRGTPLAFPPEGTLEGVKNISPADVRDFLSRQIRASEVIVAVSTNRSEAEVKGWIEKAFAGLPEGRANRLPVVIPPPLDGRVLYVVDRKGSSTTEVTFGHQGITADRKDREALETGLFAFGEDMTSRLFLELRAKKGWTYGAYAGFQLFDLPRYYGGGFMFWAFPQAEHTEELTLRALELYQDYVKSGLTGKELAFAKNSLMNSYPFKFATSRGRLTARLYHLLEGGTLQSVAAFRAMESKLNESSLLLSIQRAHDANNLVIVLVGDPQHTAGLEKSIPNLKKVVHVKDPMAGL